MLFHCCLKSKVNSQANSAVYTHFPIPFRQSKFNFRQNILISLYQSISTYYPKSQGYKILCREFIIRRGLLAFTPSYLDYRQWQLRSRALSSPSRREPRPTKPSFLGPQSLPCCSVAGFLNNFCKQLTPNPNFSVPNNQIILTHKTFLMPYKRMQQVRSVPWNANLSKGLN